MSRVTRLSSSTYFGLGFIPYIWPLLWFIPAHLVAGSIWTVVALELVLGRASFTRHLWDRRRNELFGRYLPRSEKRRLDSGKEVRRYAGSCSVEDRGRFCVTGLFPLDLSVMVATYLGTYLCIYLPTWYVRGSIWGFSSMAGRFYAVWVGGAIQTKEQFEGGKEISQVDKQQQGVNQWLVG